MHISWDILYLSHGTAQALYQIKEFPGIRIPIISTWHEPREHFSVGKNGSFLFEILSWTSYRNFKTWILTDPLHSRLQQNFKWMWQIALIYFADTRTVTRYPQRFFENRRRAIECQMWRWIRVLLMILALFSSRCITRHAIEATWDIHLKSKLCTGHGKRTH